MRVRRPRAGSLALALTATLATAAPGSGQPRERCGTPALAAAADRLAARFETRDFLFLGSTHGGEKVHDFALCLISRSSFRRHVPDLLVEFATPVHQDVLDAYLLDLAPVDPAELRRAWFDTDHPPLWGTIPQIPEFFSAVRELNEGVDRDRRLRVLGGNQPIDWASVRSVEQLARFPFKTNLAAHLLVEHLATEPGRKALVIYGDGHIHYAGGTLMSDLVGRLARDRLFVVGTIADARDGPAALAPFGDPAEPFLALESDAAPNAPLPGSLAPFAEEVVYEHFDAVLYLGPEPDVSRVGEIPLSSREEAELSRRNAIARDRRALEIRYGGRDAWFAGHPWYRPRGPAP